MQSPLRLHQIFPFSSLVPLELYHCLNKVKLGYFFFPRKVLEQLNITCKQNLKSNIDIHFTHFTKINSISRPIVKRETKNLLECNREENLDYTAFNDDFYV